MKGEQLLRNGLETDLAFPITASWCFSVNSRQVAGGEKNPQ